jgi:hypothetical protein
LGQKPICQRVGPPGGGVPKARRPQDQHQGDVPQVAHCIGFALAALTPPSPRYPGIKRFFERYGRQIAIADMQLTMVSLGFLWLAVVGTIEDKTLSQARHEAVKKIVFRTNAGVAQG